MRQVSIFVFIFVLCSALVAILNIGIIKAENNSLNVVRHFTIQEVLDGINRDSFVGSFTASKGDWIKLNLSSYSTNKGPFGTAIRICSANHGSILSARGPNFSQIIKLGYDDTYNITIYKSPTFSSVQFIGTIDVLLEEPSERSPENWVEVTTLTGVGGIGSTDSFTVNHCDLRIVWEIEPGDGSERAAFLAYIFPDIGIKGSEPWFEMIENYCTEETTGFVYIFNISGSFYMDVLASVDRYTLIVEQNIESIPELPSPGNWVEVERFSGGSWWGGTRLFRIDNFEWRIRWNYEPTIDFGSDTAVVFDIQVLDAMSERVELVRAGEKTNGTVTLRQSGEFYLYIIGFNIDDYTIIIEQNIDSIPEFPSWTILPLILIATFSVTLLKKNLTSKT